MALPSSFLTRQAPRNKSSIEYKRNRTIAPVLFKLVSRQFDGLVRPMQGTSKAEKLFRPGEEVLESGVYAVLHHNHRPKHVATIFKGERFPFCAHCSKD